MVLLRVIFQFSFNRSQTKAANIHRLPPEILFLIMKRLPIKNKFLLKAVCKKWYTFVVSHILPEQHKLSIEKGYFSTCRCIDPDHQFRFRDNNSIPVLPVRGNLNRKRFFEKEVTGVKVLKLCGGRDANRVMKYCLSEKPSSTLECVDILCLDKPLVKVLPNLKHFSTGSINLASLINVLEYCPVLTHLSIDTTYYSNDLVNTFMNLPKGLKYLKLGGTLSDFLAVFCSPAMQTLESLLLMDDLSTSVLFKIPDATIKAAPRLQRLSMNCYMNKEQDRKMIIDLLKKCPALKKIDLRVTGLTLEDYVNIFSRLFNLEMIKLGLHFEFDEVIHMILEGNRKSLKYLEIGKSLLNLESMEKLTEFTNLQALSFYKTLVRPLVLSAC